MPGKKNQTGTLNKRDLKTAFGDRSIIGQITDCSLYDIPILRDYLLYLNTDGKEGYNPEKGGSQEHRFLLNYHQAPLNWSYNKFHSRGKKLGKLALKAEDNNQVGK